MKIEGVHERLGRRVIGDGWVRSQYIICSRSFVINNVCALL
jgi:hypothetical protein